MNARVFDTTRGYDGDAERRVARGHRRRCLEGQDVGSVAPEPQGLRQLNSGAENPEQKSEKSKRLCIDVRF